MKSKFLYIALGAVALFTASCSEEELATAGIETSQGVLRATVEQTPGTRVGFGTPDATTKVAAFYWSEGDQIGTTSISSSKETTTFSTLMTLTAGAGDANGVFSGALSGSLGNYALYPYSEENKDANKIESGTLTYVFPASYTYTKLDADFYETNNSGKLQSYNAAMLGKISGGNVNFKHLGGVFCIQVPNPGTSGKLVLTANQKINGTFTATVSDATKLETAATDVDAEKSVTINYTNSEASQATGVFYIPVPVGTYDVTISVYDGDNNLINAETKTNIEVSRADLYGIRMKSFSKNTAYKEVSTTADFTSAIASTSIKYINVVGDISIASARIDISREVSVNIKTGVTVTAAMQTVQNVSYGNLLIKKGGNLTLTGGGKITADHLPAEVEDGGTLNIDGPTIEATREAASKTVACTAIYMNSGAKVNLKSGLITANNTGIYNGGGTLNISGGEINAVMIGAQNIGGSFTLSGGEIIQNTHGYSAYCGIYINGGSFTSTGGTVDAQESALFADTSAATINLKGGTFKGHCPASSDKETDHFVYTVAVKDDATSSTEMNISGDTRIEGIHGGLAFKAGTLNISGGTFVATHSPASYYALYVESINNHVYATVSGGNFYATDKVVDVYIQGHTSYIKDIVISGGNFRSNKILFYECNGQESNNADNPHAYSSHTSEYSNWTSNEQKIDDLTYYYTAVPETASDSSASSGGE